MKSPMIQNAEWINEDDKKNYSDLKVLKSNAGYYIGTEYSDTELPGFNEPGSRDTEYFKSEKEANTELFLLETGQSDLVLRMTP